MGSRWSAQTKGSERHRVEVSPSFFLQPQLASDLRPSASPAGGNATPRAQLVSEAPGQGLGERSCESLVIC